MHLSVGWQGERGPSGPPGVQGETGIGLAGPKVRFIFKSCPFHTWFWLYPDRVVFTCVTSVNPDLVWVLSVSRVTSGTRAGSAHPAPQGRGNRDCL